MYIPLNISAKRNHFVALARAPSFDSSHVLGLGILKPSGLVEMALPAVADADFNIAVADNDRVYDFTSPLLSADLANMVCCGAVVLLLLLLLPLLLLLSLLFLCLLLPPPPAFLALF